MKTQILFLLAVISTISLSGCSSDENGSTAPADGTLIKTITYTTYGINPGTTSGEFHYSGNTIESLTAETTRIEMVYSGNKVTETNHYTNDVLSRTNTYTYDGNNLAYVTSDDGERIHYLYNGNTLSQAKYQTFDEDVWTDYQMDTFVFTQDNLVEKTRTDYMPSYETRTAYTFDDKKNPTLNMNPYLRLTLNVPTIHLLSNNNPMAAQIFAPATATVPSAVYTYEYVYNTDNYPTEITVKSAGQTMSETTIEYQ